MNKYDAIIVLGRNIDKNGKIPDRAIATINKAVELYNKRFAKYIIFSGKWSYKNQYIPPITEAWAMANYAMAIGLPEKAVVIEDQSECTVENICNIKRNILLPRKWKKVACISLDIFQKRMAKNFNMVFGDECVCKFIRARYKFPRLLERKYQQSESYKLKNEVDQFFEGIKHGDDISISKKAHKEIVKRKLAIKKIQKDI